MFKKNLIKFGKITKIRMKIKPHIYAKKILIKFLLFTVNNFVFNL